MNKFKCVLLALSFILVSTLATAQVKDTSAPKSNFFSKVNFSKVHLSKLNVFKRDSTKVVKADAVVKVKDTTSVYKSFKNKFLKYTSTTTFSLLAGANFTKQVVASGGYSSDFNYNLLDINKDVFKTGFLGGIRLDGKYHNKHEYSLSFTLNKINTGAKYSEPEKLSPVIGNFSSFKAEEQFFVMDIAAHYRKQLHIGDPAKYKFYAIAGPSIATRLSNTSLENEVTAAYKRIIMKADLGIEFNNRSLYTLFMHYQHNIGSITKSPINTNMSSFEFGIIAKASDFF